MRNETPSRHTTATAATRTPRGVAQAVVMAVAVVTALSAFACGDAPEEPSAAPKTVAVETAVALPQRVQVIVNTSGSVEPWQRVSPGTKLLGQVAQVTVREGDRVQAGQLLARLEDADLRASVDQARAAVAVAEATLVGAKAQFERMTELQERGSATPKNLEDATTGYRSAEAGLEQAKAALAGAEATLRYARVTSPVAGWVVAKHIEVGDMSQPGRPFFTIENLSRVKVTAQVPESDVVGLAKGDPVQVELAVLDRTVDAVVDRVVPSADPGSRTFDVQVVLDNPDGSIKSGMFARVAFPRGEREGLLVPESALHRRGQLVGVYVVEDGRARLRWIRLGRQSDGLFEVLSGLEPGETFVVEIPLGLVDGSPVEVSR